MSRRHYLVAYDVADDKRRNVIFNTLHGFGDHVQFSVFLCDLNPRELAELRRRLADAAHHAQDQVILVDLGEAASPLSDSIQCIGKCYVPTTRVTVV